MLGSPGEEQADKAEREERAKQQHSGLFLQMKGDAGGWSALALRRSVYKTWGILPLLLTLSDHCFDQHSDDRRPPAHRSIYGTFSGRFSSSL